MCLRRTHRTAEPTAQNLGATHDLYPPVSCTLVAAFCAHAEHSVPRRVPCTMDGSDPEAIAAARAARRKAKKVLKKSGGGAGVISTPPATAAPALTSALPLLPPPVRVNFLKAARGGQHISAADVQRALLWMYLEAPTPAWCVVTPKSGITGVMVLLARGASFADWVTATRSKAVHPPTLEALPQKVVRMPRGMWRSREHEVVEMDRAIFYTSQEDARDAARAAGTSGSTVPGEVHEPSASGRAGRSGGRSVRGVRAALHFRRAPDTPAIAARRIYAACLRTGEMAANRFPLPSNWRSLLMTSASPAAMHLRTQSTLELPAGYVATQTARADLTGALGTSAGESGGATPSDVLCKLTDVSLRPRLVGMDCEMCNTLAGPQLARITLVAEGGVTLLDSVIVPTLPVTDYLTRYSGITPSMLRAATVTHAQAQERVVQLLDEVPSVLVGHSLECDLLSLRLVHTRLIDTSLLFPHPAGLPVRHSLRHLSRVYLDRAIQRGHGDEGHCSEEDAFAALHLVEHALLGRRFNGEADAEVEAVPEGALPCRSKSEDDTEAAEGDAPTDSELEDVQVYGGAPPQAKRVRLEEADTIGDELLVSASAAPYASSEAASAQAAAPAARAVPPSFRVCWCEEARSMFLPSDHEPCSVSSVASLAVGSAATGEEESVPAAPGAAATRIASRGVGSLIASLVARNDAGASDGDMAVGSTVSATHVGTPAEAVTSGRVQAGHGAGGGNGAAGRKRRFARNSNNILVRPRMQDTSVCCGITLIGSASFVTHYMAGTVNGISVPISGSRADFTRGVAKAATELTRWKAGRESGKWLGCGTVIMETYVPRLPEAGRLGSSVLPSGPPDWLAFDAQVVQLASAVPVGTVIMILAQGDLSADAVDPAAVSNATALARDADEKTYLSTSNPAAYGLFWMAVAGGSGGGSSAHSIVDLADPPVPDQSACENRPAHG